MLSVDCVGKTFGTRRVLTSASLRAPSGAVVGLIGRNGAGKSTLLKIAAGLLQADHGSVTFRGTRIERPRLATLARGGLFFLPADGFFSPALCVRTQISLLQRARGVHSSSDVIERLDVEHLLDRRPGALSGGERRRAALAAAASCNPTCLLADEPLRDLAPLDAERCTAALRALACDGCAIVVTGHEVTSVMATVDTVVWCANGTTRELGPPDLSMNEWEFRQGYLGGA
ncbi:MAG: ATP-binding cassette domain-containing protein [Gemmatimonadaceae bacterium]